jgi:hypothetical protein
MTVMLLMAAVAMVVLPVTAQDAAPGFDGYIQSGTCAAPTSDLRVDLKSEDDYDVVPYLAKADGADETITLAYYGAPSAPGFGFATIFTDERFSLVIVDPASGDPVACGDLLEPDNDDFAEIGLALVRLEPVAGSSVRGFATVERQPLEREVDVITTRVRILLMTDVAMPADGTPEATPVT